MKVTSIIPNLICVLILHTCALRTQGQSSWEFKTNVNVGANLFLTNIFDKAGSNGYKFPEQGYMWLWAPVLRRVG